MRTMVGLREASRLRSVRFDGYVPLEHPLRRVRAVVDDPRGALQKWLRAAPTVRCPIGPEQMVRALLLQFLFCIRRDLQLVDQIWHSVLFRWFVGVRVDEPKWDLEALATYREQLLKEDAVREMLLRGLKEAHYEGLLSEEALTARRCELAAYASDVTVGVGHPGVLPQLFRPSAGKSIEDRNEGAGLAPSCSPSQCK